MEIKRKLAVDYTQYTGKIDNLLKCAANVYHCYPELLYCDDTQEFYFYQSGVYSLVTEHEVIRLMRKHKGLEAIRDMDISRCKKIIENMKTLPEGSYCRYEEFDQEGLINFQDCFYNVNEDTTYPHDPSIISLIQLPYKFDREAKCPLFLSSLEEIMQGDIEKIHVLQEYFGYCLTRDCRHEKAMILLGESRTGKSVVIETLMAFIGEGNYTNVPLEKISDPNYANTFIGRFVNISTEIPQTTKNYDDDFKKITSGEPIMIKRMHKDVFKARPFVKMFFACNNMPKITDTSSAMYERLLVLELNRFFKASERDPNLKEKIMKNERAGVFNWAIEGYKRLRQRNEFSHCDTSKVFLQQLQIENNPVRQFAHDCVTVHDDKFVTHDEMFEKYMSWCQKNNVKYTMKKSAFNKELWRCYQDVTEKTKRKNIEGVKQYYWPNLQFRSMNDMYSEFAGEEIDWNN